MTEIITAITPYEGRPERVFSSEAGFQVQTTEQLVTLAIDNSQDCCESWGYFLTEDDTEKFIGAHLLGIEITDTNRSSRVFDGVHVGRVIHGEIDEYLDEGDVLFVDIRTDRGVLQFVAYNSHNGYYGHEARVTSNQLRHAVVL